MKVRLPLMVQDPFTSRLKGIRTTEDFFAHHDDFYDGPVTERFAVLDLDPDTGELLPGVKFIPPGKTLAHYDVPRITATSPQGRKTGEWDIGTRQFKQAAVLAMALKTLYLFERNKATDSDVIGRQVQWAFNAPQLFLVPRAGLSANAYYERASHSVQFFSFPSEKDPAQTIHTCLSRDIVSHETAHAILDALAPELYDAITPQSLAIHEALADLTAAFMAFESGNVAEKVLQETRGEIEDTTAFSSIAEEFGQARDPFGKAQYLRNLFNKATLGDMVEEDPDPHELSLVLSGALYRLLVRIYKEQVRPESALKYQHKPDPVFSASGEALRISSSILRRMVFGALDYLPPGDATFADLGRAIIAADRAMHPDGRSETIRRWLKQEFVERGIVSRGGELDRAVDSRQEIFKTDIDGLLSSDWVAYTFAEANRDLLRIPKGLTYKIWPRFLTNRRHKTGAQSVDEAQECIFKVSWTELEENGYAPFPRHRRVSAGTTLVIDVQQIPPVVRAVLTTDRSKAHTLARGSYLRLLFDQGLLKLDNRPDFQEGLRNSYITGETRSGAMRVRRTARMLHIVR
jgi:hypothetical protein